MQNESLTALHRGMILMGPIIRCQGCKVLLLCCLKKAPTENTQARTSDDLQDNFEIMEKQVLALLQIMKQYPFLSREKVGACAKNNDCSLVHSEGVEADIQTSDDRIFTSQPTGLQKYLVASEKRFQLASLSNEIQWIRWILDTKTSQTIMIV